MADWTLDSHIRQYGLNIPKGINYSAVTIDDQKRLCNVISNIMSRRDEFTLETDTNVAEFLIKNFPQFMQNLYVDKKPNTASELYLNILENASSNGYQLSPQVWKIAQNAAKASSLPPDEIIPFLKVGKYILERNTMLNNSPEQRVLQNSDIILAGNYFYLGCMSNSLAKAIYSCESILEDNKLYEKAMEIIKEENNLLARKIENDVAALRQASFGKKRQ